MEARIDASRLNFKELNAAVHSALDGGSDKVRLEGVNGQYYLAAGLKGRTRLIVKGTPGNDTACYMDGPELEIFGSAQDEVGNTMNSGRVIVHGHAGDVIGYGMRGGEIFIRGNVGYRVGIHMKEYMNQCPVMVIGGCTGAFLGEYMAGGRIIVLGLGAGDRPVIGEHCGSGLHGGIIYIRGRVEEEELSPQVEVAELNDDDRRFLKNYSERFCGYFHVDSGPLANLEFTKVVPKGKRPYAALYTGL